MSLVLLIILLYYFWVLYRLGLIAVNGVIIPPADLV
jgi:hypothetical protein